MARNTSPHLPRGECLLRKVTSDTDNNVSFPSAKSDGLLYLFASSAHEWIVKISLYVQLLLCFARTAVLLLKAESHFFPRSMSSFPMKKYVITRFKGLGEMNPSTLWETTLDPINRTILKITIDDVKEADKMLDRLFGKDAKDRYQMICDNAYRLDIDLL